MKSPFIKISVRIQNLVDVRTCSSLQPVTTLCLPGAGELDDERGSEAAAAGLEDGLWLAEKLAKAQKKHPKAAIYLATQELTDGGSDRFYFVGLLENIIAKIETIPELPFPDDDCAE